MNKTVSRILSALMALCMVLSAFSTVIVHDHVHADGTEEPSSTATGTEVVDDGEFTASSIRKQQYKSPEEKLATMKLMLEAYDFQL